MQNVPRVSQKSILVTIFNFLRHKAKHISGITVYRGGYVNLDDVMKYDSLTTKYPDITIEEFKNMLLIDPLNRFTIQGNFVKANEFHTFDINDKNLPELI